MTLTFELRRASVPNMI